MTTVRRVRAAAASAVVAALSVAGCLDLGSAPGGVYSISRVLLPSPGVVVGDTMRDSTGAVAPLRVLGYAVTGDTVAGTTPTFVTLDTLAHLVGGSRLVGDHVGMSRIVGGLGNVQTLPETVRVTLSPDTLTAVDSVRHLKTYSVLAGDTLVSSAELAARVLHRTGAATSDVDAVIVRYAIVRSPPAKGAIPTITVMNGNVVSDRDTTSGGRVARTLRLRVQQLTSVADDSAVVRATASYRGLIIGTVQFTVVFRNQ